MLKLSAEQFKYKAQFIVTPIGALMGDTLTLESLRDDYVIIVNNEYKHCHQISLHELLNSYMPSSCPEGYERIYDHLDARFDFKKQSSKYELPAYIPLPRKVQVVKKVEDHPTDPPTPYVLLPEW